MNTLVALAQAIDPTCVRLWNDGYTSPVTQLTQPGYDEVLNAQDHSLILNRERCDNLYHKWAASDYTLGFYEYAYADMIENMMTDHSRMVRATNCVNAKINRAPIKHLLGTIEF